MKIKALPTWARGFLRAELVTGCAGAAVLFLSSAAVPGASVPLRERISLDADWRFVKGDPEDASNRLAYVNIKDWFISTGADFSTNSAPPARPSGVPGGEVVSYATAGFDDHQWRQLNLPHDWGVETPAGLDTPFKLEYPSGTGRLAWWGVGWYRKHFAVTDADQGRKMFLQVDGAMAYASVWLNGQFVGGWPYGYASFQLELTPYLKPGGDNVLAIRVDNPPNSSRFYPGGGIYRNVWLIKTSPLHVGEWGTFVTTPEVSMAEATVDIKVDVNNEVATNSHVSVQTQIYELDAEGHKGARVGVSDVSQMSIPAGKTATIDEKIVVLRPKLWSIKQPSLYVAVTSLGAGQPADTYETTFGIRTIKFEPDKGFLLNGELTEIQGVCDHHDLGPLGSAINTRALERQVEILKDMGCNAIRTSHNPPAPELLDICDRLGVVVMDETFDCWRRGKTPNDYGKLFDDWHEKDTRMLVRRDRNHPCVILWSIGNEIPNQTLPTTVAVARELTAIVHSEDPTRPTTAACNEVGAGYSGFQTAVDVFGYNYKPNEYVRFHVNTNNATIPLFGSETASCISTRGEYFFPVTENKNGGQQDNQMSSYDLYAPSWATPPDSEFRGQDRAPYSAGEFVWTGFDYLGEPTPFGRGASPSRSSYFGIIDLDGFPKDRFYIYQARWRPDFPMAHILPHWTWGDDRVGQVTPVHVYTSGDEAELFLNGKSLGRKKMEPLQYRLRWDDVVYERGELKVVAYKNGKEWATDTMKTAGPAAKLALAADRDKIHADGQDLSFITVSVRDKDGVMFPQAKNYIQFSVEGPGEIIATDNGDPTCFEAFQAKEHSAFNGLCLVIVRTKPGQSGDITVQAKSAGLEPASVKLSSQ